jgi:hypothetical protein
LHQKNHFIRHIKKFVYFCAANELFFCIKKNKRIKIVMTGFISYTGNFGAVGKTFPTGCRAERCGMIFAGKHNYLRERERERAVTLYFVRESSQNMFK